MTAVWFTCGICGRAKRNLLCPHCDAGSCSQPECVTCEHINLLLSALSQRRVGR